MFNFLKKNQLKIDDWNKVLRSRILPESEYYYSKVSTFDKSFIDEEINLTFSPHNSVNQQFNKGLYLKNAGFDDKVSTAYLQVSLDIANTILALPQSETERWNEEDLYTGLFKPNISIDKIFLDALLANENIKTTKLSQLNLNLLDYLKNYKGRLWEDVTQSRYLSSIWNLIIAGEFQEAKARLSVRKSFRYVENLHQWTKQINNLLIAEQSEKEVEAELKQVFDEIFHIIRSPYWKTNEQKEENVFTITMDPDYVRFQLAIIRWLYIEKQPLKGHWNEVLAQVSK